MDTSRGHGRLQKLHWTSKTSDSWYSWYFSLFLQNLSIDHFQKKFKVYFHVKVLFSPGNKTFWRPHKHTHTHTQSLENERSHYSRLSEVCCLSFVLIFFQIYSSHHLAKFKRNIARHTWMNDDFHQMQCCGQLRQQNTFERPGKRI